MIELNKLYNCDCMELMSQIPDKYFELAIVDPPYGGGSTDQHNSVSELCGGGTDWQDKKRSRFGGMFDKYHISKSDGRHMVDEVSDSHRGVSLTRIFAIGT